jgi:hypothetical protein
MKQGKRSKNFGANSGSLLLGSEPIWIGDYVLPLKFAPEGSLVKLPKPFLCITCLRLGDELDLFYYVIDEVEDDLWVQA